VDVVVVGVVTGVVGAIAGTVLHGDGEVEQPGVVDGDDKEEAEERQKQGEFDGGCSESSGAWKRERAQPPPGDVVAKSHVPYSGGGDRGGILHAAHAGPARPKRGAVRGPLIRREKVNRRSEFITKERRFSSGRTFLLRSSAQRGELPGPDSRI